MTKLLLLGDTDDTATASGGLHVLSTHTKAPVVTQTSVGAHPLQALVVITKLGFEDVGNGL